jgi:hypothetical protein
MARGCSVCTLYALNFALFLVGLALIAAPFVSCTETCHLPAATIESLRFVRVLQVVGACLLLFAMLGCGLARSGKKRYRCPYLLVLLLAVCGGGLIVALDNGLLYQKLETFDPSAPEKVQKAVDGLATSGMQSFYADFAGVFHAAECKVEAAGPHESHVTCQECEPIQTAFTTCMDDWKPGPEADKYLEQCTKQFANTQKDCDGDCTLAFCRCTKDLDDAIEEYAKYFKYVLLGVGGVLLLLLVASVCVSRKEEPEQVHELGQVFVVEQQMQQQRRAQPVLA